MRFRYYCPRCKKETEWDYHPYWCVLFCLSCGLTSDEAVILSTKSERKSEE